MAATKAKTSSTGMSEDTKSIITVLLLIFVTPVGLILMWFWTKWKTWVKLLVSVPAIIATIVTVLFVIGMVIGVAAGVDPKGQMMKAACVKECGGQANSQCAADCYLKNTMGTSDESTQY